MNLGVMPSQTDLVPMPDGSKGMSPMGPEYYAYGANGLAGGQADLREEARQPQSPGLSDTIGADRAAEQAAPGSFAVVSMHLQTPWNCSVLSG